MRLFDAITTAVKGIFPLHATLPALASLLAIFSLSFSVVKADNILVGRCGANCDEDLPTSDIWWDPSQRKIGSFKGINCYSFSSLVNRPLYVAVDGCGPEDVKVEPHGCAASPVLGNSFKYICPPPPKEETVGGYVEA